MDTINPHEEVRVWLLSMIGHMIAVMILQKAETDRSEQVLWQGQGKVLRCVQEGAVLDLNAGGATWLSRFWKPRTVAPLWIKKPLSVPYRDLWIDREPKTGEKRLVIDAVTWKRSPEELTQ